MKKRPSSTSPPKAPEDQGADFFRSESFKRLSRFLPTADELKAEWKKMRAAQQEINEERRPEVAILSTLKRMAGELETLRKEPERRAEKIRAFNEELSLYRPGAPGRPGSGHLVKPEFERRLNSGRVEANLSEQARVLVEWLEETHPLAHPLTRRTVENLIRHRYHEARSKGKRSRPRNLR